MMKVNSELLAILPLTLCSFWVSANNSVIQLSASGIGKVNTSEQCAYVAPVTTKDGNGFYEGLGCPTNPAKFALTLVEGKNKQNQDVVVPSSTAWDICQKTHINVDPNPFDYTPNQVVPTILNSIHVVNHCEPGETGYAELNVYDTRQDVDANYSKDVALVLYTTNTPYKDPKKQTTYKNNDKEDYGVKFYITPAVPSEGDGEGWPKLPGDPQYKKYTDSHLQFESDYTHDENGNINGLKIAFCNWASDFTGKIKGESFKFEKFKVAYKVNGIPASNVAMAAAFIVPDKACSKVNNENNYNN
ncbi:hypothetical protein JQC92_09730 [Shewanella sp. 202IG2-18]|uniref:hypothetical protein n=1 Tax=Parashewanella hymeniacidonis TaxID=2807618 RepID=UPI00195F7ACA|nr:hypothetical protein [Parashewanella hymeniacidonis]MBM7072307.1 hypothetical protein [Parashewanella hymeniacidonis]